MGLKYYNGMQMLSDGTEKTNNITPANNTGAAEPFFKPAIQRKEDGAVARQVPPATKGWSQDLLTITVFDDSYKGDNCFGSASPGELLRLSSCLKWPSCRQFNIPLRIEFYIDRLDKPYPEPADVGPVSVNITFTPNGGKPNTIISSTDAKPVYKGQNRVLEPSFGKVFPVDITTDGVLNVSATLHDKVTGQDVVYTDRASFVILCS